MKQVEIVVTNPTGLHARPAKVFVNLAKQYQAAIKVLHGGKTANGKSLISMLTLGVECGSQITLLTDGEDEDTALEALLAAIEAGLGEEESANEAPAPAKKAQAEAEPVREQPASGPADDRRIQGIPAAPGIVVGPVFLLKRTEIEVTETFGSPEEEETQLQEAIEKARGQLGLLRNKLAASGASSEAAIFDVHLELLEDVDLLDAVLEKLHNGQSAAQAWMATIETRARLIAALDDPLLAARAADLRDVGYRVLSTMMNVEDGHHKLPEHPTVIIAQELSPSDTASLDRSRVLGLCTASGGPTSHAAIIARALSLPAVVGAGSRLLEVANGTTVILNGDTGVIEIEPEAEALARAQESRREWQEVRRVAQEQAVEPAVTRDGHRVEVVANIGGVADARKAAEMGAEGVGLLRTEFLFLDRAGAPTEAEQFDVYRAIAQALDGQPVIVRTLDVGGDKPLPYIEVAAEENPFLGERGIRLCLARPELFRQQLSAILKAAVHGKLRIMFPMVADVTEWRAARALVEEIRAQLGAPEVELGIMIEVPSAALMADAFADEVDFFSIGTNDLTQYTLAMDRMHPTLAAKSDGLHPAVLRLIAKTVEAAHQAGKWVGVCGELGADPLAIPILVGLGVDELSVSVPAIPMVKAQIRTLDLPEAQALAREVLNCATSSEVRTRAAAGKAAAAGEVEPAVATAALAD